MRSFPPKTIVESYRKSGFYPYSAKQIMSQCTEWGPLDQLEKERLLEVIKLLAITAATKGKITEAEMDLHNVPVNALPNDVLDELEALGDNLELLEDEVEAVRKKDELEGRTPGGRASTKLKLDDMHASRQRCMWLNNEFRLAVLKAEREARERDAQEKEAARDQYTDLKVIPSHVRTTHTRARSHAHAPSHTHTSPVMAPLPHPRSLTSNKLSKLVASRCAETSRTC